MITPEVDLVYHEYDLSRRYFQSMKGYETDGGISPQTLADSFIECQVFLTTTDALSFAQQLRNDSCSLVVYSDLLAATQCLDKYKRQKMRSHLKIVASRFANSYSSHSDTGTHDCAPSAAPNNIAPVTLLTPNSTTEIIDISKEQQEVVELCQTTRSKNFISKTLESGRRELTRLLSNVFESEKEKNDATSKQESFPLISPGVVPKEAPKSVNFHRFDSGDPIAPPVKVKHASIKFYSPKNLVQALKGGRERHKVGCHDVIPTRTRFFFNQLSTSGNFTESSL